MQSGEGGQLFSTLLRTDERTTLGPVGPPPPDNKIKLWHCCLHSQLFYDNGPVWMDCLNFTSSKCVQL